jgi:hypothetical protein
MNMQNVDLRTIETGLTEAERREALYEAQRIRQRELLGTRWVLHPANSPKRGNYNPRTGQCE